MIRQGGRKSVNQAKSLESSNVSGKGVMTMGKRSHCRPLCLLFYGFWQLQKGFNDSEKSFINSWVWVRCTVMHVLWIFPPACIFPLWSFIFHSPSFQTGCCSLQTPSSGSLIHLSSSTLLEDPSFTFSRVLSDFALFQSSQENGSRKLIWRLPEYEMNLCAPVFFYQWA